MLQSAREAAALLPDGARGRRPEAGGVRPREVMQAEEQARRVARARGGVLGEQAARLDVWISRNPRKAIDLLLTVSILLGLSCQFYHYRFYQLGPDNLVTLHSHVRYPFRQNRVKRALVRASRGYGSSVRTH
jgi:hypothetical protein